MTKFQVEVSVSASGYIDVEAETEAGARKKVGTLECLLRFPGYPHEGVDLEEWMDSAADLTIHGVTHDDEPELEPGTTPDNSARPERSEDARGSNI